MSAVQAPRRSAGLQLPILAEPVGLKRASRVMAEEEPGRAATLLTEPDWVAGHLWEGWGAQLEQAGIDRAAFTTVLAGYRRELWYWVWGNRTWAHCTQGLVGRLARRAGRPPETRTESPMEEEKGG